MSSTRILRLACALDQPGAALDPRTNQAPAAHRGADLRVQLAAFVAGALVDPSGLYDTLTLLVRAIEADGTIGAVQFTKAIAGAALTACTQEEWDDGDGQHAEIALDGDDLNLEEGRYKLVVYGLTNEDESQRVSWCSAFFTIADIGLVDGAPPDPVDQFYTKDEADDRFMRLTPPDGAFRISADGKFVQLLDSATAKWRSMWLENGAPQFGAEED